MSTYEVRLTGAQLSILCEVLPLILNDPDWSEATAMSAREMATLARAYSILERTQARLER